MLPEQNRWATVCVISNVSTTSQHPVWWQVLTTCVKRETDDVNQQRAVATRCHVCSSRAVNLDSIPAVFWDSRTLSNWERTLLKETSVFSPLFIRKIECAIFPVFLLEKFIARCSTRFLLQDKTTTCFVRNSLGVGHGMDTASTLVYKLSILPISGVVSSCASRLFCYHKRQTYEEGADEFLTRMYERLSTPMTPTVLFFTLQCTVSLSILRPAPPTWNENTKHDTRVQHTIKYSLSN